MEREEENPAGKQADQLSDFKEFISEKEAEKLSEETEEEKPEVLVLEEAEAAETLEESFAGSQEEVLEGIGLSPQLENEIQEYNGCKEEKKDIHDVKQGTCGEALKEETDEKLLKKFSLEKCKKAVWGGIITFTILMVSYCGMALYFTNHFYIGSQINGQNVSGKSVEAVESIFTSELKEYNLTLNEREGKSEQIKANEIGLAYDKETFNELKKGQQPLGWLAGIFSTKKAHMRADVEYDESLLTKRMETLQCFSTQDVIEPKNPILYYTDDRFVIISEIQGNQVDQNVLYPYIAKAIIKQEKEVDLEAIDCYIKPQYQSASSEVIAAQDLLNRYISSQVTYIFGEHEIVLEGEEISRWLRVDEGYRVEVDEQEAAAYIQGLVDKYNKPGRTRNFTASSGQTIQVNGGDFIRQIDQIKEVQSLISAIKEGKTIAKEASYEGLERFEGNEDIGNTYVEIDLTNQHLWFYKEGVLIAEGDVVTGNVRTGHTTPKGVYRLKYKAKNVVLRGPGYAAPVSFWMPFNGGIGIHDATWRSAFGGTIYRGDGSHGCINCPLSLARTIYEHIEADTPVVCYW